MEKLGASLQSCGLGTAGIIMWWPGYCSSVCCHTVVIELWIFAISYICSFT
jgi:hypothetical protein